MRTAWGELIEKNREKILDQWIEKGLSIFPEKIGRGTPIGESLSEGLSIMLDGIEENTKSFVAAVNQIARILAVQPLPPSKALLLFSELKAIFHETASKASKRHALTQADRDAFQARIEQILLTAFDFYMANREKIYQLKVEESKRQAFMLIRRAQG